MRFRRLGGLVAVPALVFAALAASPGAVTASTLATFNTHGTYTWTVPSGVYKVTFDVFGASGGHVAQGNLLVSAGGSGGEAKGTFKVKPGEVFEIVVGGAGPAQTGSTEFLAGGFNGGGEGGTYGGAGGGASDVRIGGRGNWCAGGKSCGLGDRLIVGGGGGGGGTSGYDGGAGGGLNGSDGSPNGRGGGQEDPYLGHCSGGAAFPCFGYGGFDTSNYPGAGGGGGWYGGEFAYGQGSGGSGGSGFISRLAITGSFPGGTRTGDGLVVIKSA